MKLDVNDVAIIGAGPAGMAAAIYLLRAGINPVIFEKEAPGGNLNKTFRIENYPGYIDKEGTTLAFRMYSQLEELNANLKIESVTNIIEEDGILRVITSKNKYNFKYIILASGRTPRKLDCEGSKEYENKGISYCATCDGALYKNKDVVIIGGGNTAFETANYLSKMANKITLINRSNILKADAKEVEEVKKLDNVNILLNKKVVKVEGNNDTVTNIILDDETSIKTNGVFICIGQNASDNYYQSLKLKTNTMGIEVDGDMKSSNDLVYAVGDSVSKKLYQVVTATSDGALAATSIINKLRNNDNK